MRNRNRDRDRYRDREGGGDGCRNMGRGRAGMGWGRAVMRHVRGGIEGGQWRGQLQYMAGPRREQRQSQERG